MIIISAEMSKEKEAVQLVTREFADNTQSKWTNDENTPKKKKNVGFLPLVTANKKIVN